MKTIKKINQELDSKIPDITNEVKSRVNWEEIRLNNIKESKPIKFNYKIAFASLCSVFVLTLALILPLQLSKNPTNNNSNVITNPITEVAYSVVLDINPRIKFNVNNQNIVIKQTPLNKDGVVLLYKNNLVGQRINEATKNIISTIDHEGLLANSIKFSVIDNNGDKITSKETTMSEEIKKFIHKDTIDITSLTENELDALENYYKENKISEYEKNFIKEFQETLKTIVNEKITTIDKIIEDLKPYAKDIEQEIQDFNENIKLEIEDFTNRYKYESNLDWLKLTCDAIFDFSNELLDHKDDLMESLIEINEENDDYNELLEDLFDLVKDELFKEDD